jgi:hypothetical protein
VNRPLPPASALETGPARRDSMLACATYPINPVDFIRLFFAYTGIYVSRTATRPKHGHPLQEVR